MKRIAILLALLLIGFCFYGCAGLLGGSLQNCDNYKGVESRKCKINWCINLLRDARDNHIIAAHAGPLYDPRVHLEYAKKYDVAIEILKELRENKHVDKKRFMESIRFVNISALSHDVCRGRFESAQIDDYKYEALKAVVNVLKTEYRLQHGSDVKLKF